MTEEREGKWARKAGRFFDQRVDRIKRARPRLAVRRLWWYHKRIGRLVIYERIKRRKCLVWQAGLRLYRERIRVPLSLVWDSIGRDVDKNSSYAYIRLHATSLQALSWRQCIDYVKSSRLSSDGLLLLLFLFFSRAHVAQITRKSNYVSNSFALSRSPSSTFTYERASWMALISRINVPRWYLARSLPRHKLFIRVYFR